MESRLPQDALPWQDQSDPSRRLWGQISGSAGHPPSIKAFMQEKLPCTFILSGFGWELQCSSRIASASMAAGFFQPQLTWKLRDDFKLSSAPLYEYFALPEFNSAEAEAHPVVWCKRKHQVLRAHLMMTSSFAKLMAVIKSEDYLFSPPDNIGGRSCWPNIAKLLEKSLWARAAFQGLLHPPAEFQALTQSS